jgi:anaerobic selenocysteine-containing dehydrogenase
MITPESAATFVAASVVVAILIAIATRALSAWARRARGWQSVGDDELTMPCRHPTRRLTVTAVDPQAVDIGCICAACGADCYGDLYLVLESDGRVAIENGSDREFAIAIDGELHNLAPRALAVGGTRVVRRYPGYRLDDDLGMLDDDHSMPGYGDQGDHDRDFGG